MAEQQGTSNTTTPSSKKTRGRLPVITLPAVTETGEANILLRAPTTFAVAIDPKSDSYVAAGAAFMSGYDKTGDGNASSAAIVRYQTNDDEDRPEYADLGTLVQVTNLDTKTNRVNLKVIGQVTLDNVMSEPYAIKGRQVPVECGDWAEYENVNPTAKIKDDSLAGFKKAIEKSLQKFMKTSVQHPDENVHVTQQSLDKYISYIHKDPFEAINFLIVKYADAPGRESFDALYSLVLTSNNPSKYMGEALAAFDLFVTQPMKISVELETGVKKAGVAALEKLQREQQLYVQRLKTQAELDWINKELGEDESEVDEYENLLKEKKAAGVLPEPVIKECEKILGQVKRNPNAMTHVASKHALDIFLKHFPFGKDSLERPDIDSAKELLDENHYGLDEVKERILDQLAVDIRRARNDDGYTGKPLLLVGPKGIGKTTLAKAVAAATGRELAFVPFGGVNDPNELRGHGRTYIGSKEGSIVGAFIRAEHANPLLFLDEIDKSGSDMRGNPQEVLMALTDPSQNKTFKDNFLEVPMDLSGAKIVATANHLDRINPILLDRFEVIDLGQYSVAEKFEIAKRHIIPRMVKEAGLDDGVLTFSDEAVDFIIEEYTHSEPGVRRLEATVKKLAEKATRQLEMGAFETIQLTPDLIKQKQWLDKPRGRPDEIPAINTVGWVNGLYGSSMGGGVLPIKVSAFSSMNDRESQITHTGGFGDQMQESLKNVSTVIKGLLDKSKLAATQQKQRGILGKSSDQDKEAKAFKRRWRIETDFHIEAVGNMPVNGPSAGITMTTAIVSHIFELPIDRHVAMTGKIDVHGKVHGIGGLEQKIPAARKAGVKTVLVPEENRVDVERLKPDEKDGVNIVFVSDITEVLPIAIPGIEHKIDLTPIQPKTPANQNIQAEVPVEKHVSLSRQARKLFRGLAGGPKI